MARATTETGLNTLLASRDPAIVIGNNITITSPKTINYATNISGEAGVSLFWGSPTTTSPSMFIVSSTGNLSMNSLILDAQERNGNLVEVNGGVFTMNDGVTLRNVNSPSTGFRAVKVGDNMNELGGTFIMNGGLITNISTAESAVFCSGGTVTINNDAVISDNQTAGILVMCTSTAARVRSTLTITGQSRISNNTSSQPGGGIYIFESDAVIGPNEGDAPLITGNTSPNHIGAIFVDRGSTLAIGHGTEISNNTAALTTGAILAQTGSTLHISGDAAIKNNTSGTNGGAIVLTSDTVAIFEDNVEISGNSAGSDTTTGNGGGVLMQTGASLEIKGNVTIHGNTASNGAGIYLSTPSSSSTYGPPVMTIGTEDSSPSVYENTAREQGGGIFISDTCEVFIAGHAKIEENEAQQGKGVYNDGILKVGESLQISDGLFFDDPAAEPMQPAQSGKEPIIEEILTTEAVIQVESSGHVSPPNVPLVLAVKGEARDLLGETDRAAWIIPSDFGASYAVILNTELDKVLIVLISFTIEYNGLEGAEHQNPISYTMNDLPITLAAPGERPGYTFAGWRDASGNFVTEIPVGTSGNLSFTAVWTELFLNFDANAPHACNIPKRIRAKNGVVTIPSTVPSRPCHIFLFWNHPDSGSGKVYFPGDTVYVSGKSVTLRAQWLFIGRCCH